MTIAEGLIAAAKRSSLAPDKMDKPRARCGRRAIAESTLADVRRLLAAGTGKREIAQQTGVSLAMVYKVARQA